MSGDPKKSWRSFAPERVRDFFERRRLEAQVDTIDAKFQPLLDAAKDAREQHHVEQAWNFESDELYEELGRLLSKRLQKQAARWSVDIPDDYWANGRYTDHRYIGYGSATKLRRAIRNARREAVRWWMQVVVMPLIALFSLMIALISLRSRLR